MSNLYRTMQPAIPAKFYIFVALAISFVVPGAHAQEQLHAQDFDGLPILDSSPADRLWLFSTRHIASDVCRATSTHPILMSAR